MGLTLYLLRHGQTACSREDVFCGAAHDPELTDEGYEMAEAFASAYHSRSWSAIYTSGLVRTIATGKPLCQALGIKPEIRDDFQEIAYGKWEGMTKEEVEREYGVDYSAWLADPAWHAPTGGETAVAIARRGLRSIEEIQQKFSDGNVLIISHKATIRIMLCGILGIDLGLFRYRLACPVGSVNVVEFTSHGPLLRALADRSHLSERLRSLPGT